MGWGGVPLPPPAMARSPHFYDAVGNACGLHISHAQRPVPNGRAPVGEPENALSRQTRSRPSRQGGWRSHGLRAGGRRLRQRQRWSSECCAPAREPSQVRGVRRAGGGCLGCRLKNLTGPPPQFAVGALPASLNRPVERSIWAIYVLQALYTRPAPPAMLFRIPPQKLTRCRACFPHGCTPQMAVVQPALLHMLATRRGV